MRLGVVSRHAWPVGGSPARRPELPVPAILPRVRRRQRGDTGTVHSSALPSSVHEHDSEDFAPVAIRGGQSAVRANREVSGWRGL